MIDDELFLHEEGTVDPEGIVENIDIDVIEKESKDTAFNMCRNLREVYLDDEFMSKNPIFKERLDVELESLRVLVKMRKSDEIVHDLCLRSIGMNANNASLYAALAKVQGRMLNIQSQMDETVKNINNLLKNVQMELDFTQNKNDDTQEQLPQDSGITRGSKKFIEQMNAELNEEQKAEE